MSATQEVDKLAFGTGRVYVLPNGASQYLKYGKVNEFDIDIKFDLKEIFDENGFPFAVFDARKTIDVSVKHYMLRLDALAQDLSQSAPAASTFAYSYDEAVTVPGTPFHVTLAQGANYLAGTLDLVMIVNGAEITYNFVTAGSEVAGVSCSIGAGGVLTFASGDTGLTGKATYQYTNTSGKQIQLVNTYQNSGAAYKLQFLKRDKSRVDSGVGQLLVTLNAVRFGGIKAAYKEGSETVYERTIKAYADVTGMIGTIQLVNTSTNNAP